jgi:hypothetical protein
MTVSEDGSTLVVGSDDSLVTIDGVWTFADPTEQADCAILLNGTHAAGGYASFLRVSQNGKLFAYSTKLHSWYIWADDGWQQQLGDRSDLFSGAGGRSSEDPQKTSIDNRNARIRRYLDQGEFSAVEGVCDGETLRRIRLYHDLQAEKSIVGDLMEIGVFHGRLFLMLALLARPDETATAVDVFEVDANYDPSGGTTTLNIVRGHYERFVGDSAKFSYVAGDSLYLTPEIIRRNLPNGRARIISIDGAHSHFHTVHDMRLAESLLGPGGIVMVDDITNGGWPGVMEGVSRYFLLSSEIRLFPFMLTLNKLWLTTYDYHRIYLDYARQHISPGRVTNFFGSETVSI